MGLLGRSREPHRWPACWRKGREGGRGALTSPFSSPSCLQLLRLLNSRSQKTREPSGISCPAYREEQGRVKNKSEGEQKVKVLVAQSCLITRNHMDCSPPGSYVCGISQARTLEQVAISSSRGSFWPRDLTQVSYISCTAVGSLPLAPPGKPDGDQAQWSLSGTGRGALMEPVFSPSIIRESQWSSLGGSNFSKGSNSLSYLDNRAQTQAPRVESLLFKFKCLISPQQHDLGASMSVKVEFQS